MRISRYDDSHAINSDNKCKKIEDIIAETDYMTASSRLQPKVENDRVRESQVVALYFVQRR